MFSSIVLTKFGTNQTDFHVNHLSSLRQFLWSGTPLPPNLLLYVFFLFLFYIYNLFLIIFFLLSLFLPKTSELELNNIVSESFPFHSLYKSFCFVLFGLVWSVFNDNQIMLILFFIRFSSLTNGWIFLLSYVFIFMQ